MLLPVFKFCLYFAALLPLPVNHMLGCAIGWIFWMLPTRERATARTNLALCYPKMSRRQRDRIGRLSLIETGKSLTEIAWFWNRSREDLEARMEIVGDENVFTDSPDGSCGTLFITPHFGAWEFCTVVLARLKNPAFLYKPPRASSLEPVIREGRSRFGAELIPVSGRGLKSLLKALRDGRSVGVLPDQEPDRQNGIFADFFDTPANTATLISAIVRRTDCPVVCLLTERLPRGKGYRIHVVPINPAITDADAQVAARALNETVERCVAICPQQYVWNYRRFRLKPDNTRRSYKAAYHADPNERREL